MTEVQSANTTTTPAGDRTSSSSSEEPLVRSDSLSFSDDEKSMLGCSFSRQWLIHMAHKTLQIAHEGQYINKKGEAVEVGDAFRRAVDNSEHYHSSHVFRPEQTTQPRFESTEFHVCWGSSLQVASKLHEELILANENGNNAFPFEIGILNSASGKNPDKFLRGTLSQEEGICRASFLYPCLAQYKERPHHFYMVNSKAKYLDSSSSCAIYCPSVPVIREDSSVKGDLMDQPNFFSFVNIPAPNAFLFGDESDDEIIPRAQAPGAESRNESYEHMTIDVAMRDRIFRALSIFAEQKCTDLVLCAFGCGVHGNNPQKIASLFKSIILNELKGRFRVVAFAIQPSRHTSYESFCQVFETKEE